MIPLKGENYFRKIKTIKKNKNYFLKYMENFVIGFLKSVNRFGWLDDSSLFALHQFDLQNMSSYFKI